jgi:zinc D-Ala-D-Ala carboxypeptidase
MTKNFSDAEVTCKCGCGMLPMQDFMDKVQAARDQLGKVLAVSSGARCAAHNARQSSTGTTGPHTTGRAIDLLVRGADALNLVVIAVKLGFTGIGVSQRGTVRFIHLDDLPNGPNCPRPYIWSY